MGTERESVAGYAEEFVRILGEFDIDYRLGVIGGQCQFIANDTEGISPEAIGLLRGADTDCIGSFPVPIPGFGTFGGGNGHLCDPDCSGLFACTGEGRFVTSSSEFQTCVEQMSAFGGEFTLSMGAIAISRALPRAEGVETKIRPGAEVVLVVITDEHDQYFEDVLDWMTAAVDGPRTPDEEAALQAIVDRYLAYLGLPNVAATVFGIYWVPGETCAGGAEVAFGIHEVVTGTGGTAGSICLSDITATLEEVARASSGLASSYRLAGRPVALTLQVAAAASGEESAAVDRSRIDGFDFDGTVNRIIFIGDSVPEDTDEVTISYQRWVGGTLGCEDDDDCPGKYYCRAAECI
jgi:hypothetical protein